jgi:hypothetical protein
MIIKASESLYSVLKNKGSLLVIGADQLRDKIKDAQIMPYFKNWYGKKIYPKYDPKELTGCTMIDLRNLEYKTDIEDYFYSVIKVQLGFGRRKAQRLSYLQSMKLFVDTTETAARIFAKFNSLDFPISQEEKAAQVERRSLGLYDLVRTFCKLMPQYKVKEAWGLDWEFVFVELEANRAEMLTQRNYQKILENKHKS